MAALTKDEALETIANHEWMAGPSSTQVMCPSCGAYYRVSAKRRHHRPGCNWVKFTIMAMAGHIIVGGSQ